MQESNLDQRTEAELLTRKDGRREDKSQEKKKGRERRSKIIGEAKGFAIYKIANGLDLTEMKSSPLDA